MRLGEETFPKRLVESPDNDRVEEPARLGDREAAGLQRLKTIEVADLLAAREHERNGVSAQSTGDKGQDAYRFGIEPLSIVDDAEKWSRGGRLGQQAEDGQADEVAVGGVA